MLEKTYPFEELCQIIEKHKEKGETIVLVHGFFDMFHRGHANLLKEAKKLGDVLVVGLDHDANTFMKDREKTIHAFDDRAYVLEQIGHVDYIYKIPDASKESDLKEFYGNFYVKLKPDIVTSNIASGKYGLVKKERAERAGAKFADIGSNYKLSTSKLIELLKCM
ncbi:adenylyltransferase/cytidyltransferase family protein [Patescibacteria group bacterium]